ncbi:LOW QUALITY PROTEIN: uncharacterized protein [Panulirus ornatus]|uniref:LOW QUALITY PROTEIN: uncharacterized protein n=1 Tax=Panulirus ornatus TaxID=150431 RepID=UPI003A85C4EE
MNWSKTYITTFVLLSVTVCSATSGNDTAFPPILQGDWFSWEEGRSVETEIIQNEIIGRGRPVDRVMIRRDTYDYVFAHQSGCFLCSRFLIRSWNILERLESPCITRQGLKEASTSSVCAWLTDKRNGYIMFRQDPSPLNCRSAIHGLYHFSWQNRFSYTGECDHPRALIKSCQKPGSQFLMENQQFSIHYKKCQGIRQSFDATVVFSCLGDWHQGKNQYFAVFNTKESRKEEKYRCFVRNREDDLYLGHSLTPECSVLKTPENSPIRFKLSYAKFEEVTPGCFLPRNLTGKWQSTGLGEAEVVINATHMQETIWRGYAAKTSTYVCLEQRGNRYLMAKLSVEGCQTEYVCWELLPRHHNIVRYRLSWALIYRHFQVCDYANFRSGREWMYDTLIADNPDPISCPFGGRFSFSQSGPSPLTPRIIGGITSSPLDTYPCQERVADMSVCDEHRKWIVIDTNLCLSLNKDGHPQDFNSVTDYRLQCVGYWHENLLSYLVTHDPSDSVSRFRCWVYQRVGVTKLLLSQSVGAACGLRQTFLSSTYEESAAVALNLTLSERIHDQCPMFYDNGKNPWQARDETVTVFRFTSHVPPVNAMSDVMVLLQLVVLVWS